MKLDDANFEVIEQAVEAGVADKAFWHSRTPNERLVAMELMRRKKYGYDQHSMPKLERVIEVIDISRYKAGPEANRKNPPPKQS
jgi:hypothetical protein